MASSSAFECSICTLAFSSNPQAPLSPKTMKCGHSACGSCLQTLSARQATFQCPFCRENCTVQEIRTNFAMLAAIEALKGVSLSATPSPVKKPKSIPEQIAACDEKLTKLRAQLPETEDKIESYEHTANTLRELLSPDQVVPHLQQIRSQLLKKRFSRVEVIEYLTTEIKDLREGLSEKNHAQDCKAEAVALRALLEPGEVLQHAKSEVAFLHDKVARLEERGRIEELVEQANGDREDNGQMCRFYPNCRFSARQCHYYHPVCVDFNMDECQRGSDCDFDHALVE